MKLKHLVLICAGLVLFLTGCQHVAGNYRAIQTDTTALPDSTKIIVVDGKEYKCVNEDGTWRCVELEALSKMLTRDGQPDASQRSAWSDLGHNRPQGQNERR